ncbi:MAG TPA: prepilin-type N-terminal cleavage/methylation domain-containing protein [Gemmataceae bacterium]|jgi:prepilin-type N-terminal cleavage/methylation domain-containing protein|nr:prepilin-type N-terminal cleavage/methylation domain-containing protein [Gemmataceae bacterium]
MARNRSCSGYALSLRLRVRDSREAFTLFELILVMALIVLLSAAIYPNIEAMYGDSKVTASGDMIRAAWAEAQAHAMNEGRPYRFAVRPYTGDFRVAPDGTDYWSGGAGAPDTHDPANPILVQETTLPKGVRFGAPETSSLNPGNNNASPAAGGSDSGSGSWDTVVTFLPDGTARIQGDQQDASIVINARGARPLECRIRGLTGVITVKTVEGKHP